MTRTDTKRKKERRGPRERVIIGRSISVEGHSSTNSSPRQAALGASEAQEVAT